MNKLRRGESCANPKFEITGCTVADVADNLDTCALSMPDRNSVDGNIDGVADKLAKEFVLQVFSAISFGPI